MMKYIFYAILIYVIYRLVSFWHKIGRAASPSPPRSSESLSGTMVKDEVCQTYLPQENALREMIDGKEHYFCSAECRRKALEGRKADR